MKRIVFILSLLLLVLSPTSLFAEKKIYVGHTTTSDPSGPRRGSTFNILTITIDQETCEFFVIVNQDISDFRLTLTQMGITYIDEQTEASLGQVFEFCLANYEEGDYELTIYDDGTVIDMFTVTIVE